EYNINVPENYVYTDTVSAYDSITIAVIPWKDFFNDEQLTLLINKAIEYNFDMQTALKNIEIAQLKADQAKLNWLPSVDATLARSEEHTSELQSRENLVCRLLLEKKNNTTI